MEEGQDYFLRVAEMRSLAEDSLFGRQLITHGCFVSDAAGPKLRALRQSALPVIENVIRDNVIPELRPHDDANALSKRFRHLSTLLVSYFGIIHDTNEQERCVQFMQGLPSPLRIQAILAAGCVNEWLSRKSALPEVILNYLRQIALHEEGPVAQVAKDRLRHTWKHPVD